MSKYTRRKPTATSDEFVSFWEEFFAKITPYTNTIGLSLVVAVAVVFAAWGMNAYGERRAEGATDLFTQAVKIYESDLLAEGAKPKEGEDVTTPRFATAKERADAALKQLDELEKKFASTKVANDAQLVRGGVMYDLERYDESEKAYHRAAQSAIDRATKATAQEGVGLALEAQNKLDDALAAYKTLEQAAKKGEYFFDRARFDQARILEKKGEKAKAGEIYKDLLTNMAQGSPLRDDVQQRLGLLAQ